MSAKEIKTIFTLLLLFASAKIFSADIVIPTFELITKGTVSNDSFILQSKGNIDLRLEGGYKFGGNIQFSFSNDDLEQTFSEEGTSASLEFLSAGITLKELFSSPFNLEYFIGESDSLCSGEFFPDIFGTNPIENNYKDYAYFGDGVNYQGLHTIKGTGLKLSTNQISPWFYGSLFAYQEGNLDEKGFYSADFQSMMNFENIKLELFAGGTWPYHDYGDYRGGFLLFVQAGENGSFLSQIGIPSWNPSEDISLDNFYFLFEPKVNFGLFCITPTFFWHPEYYLLQETNELGSIDINLDLCYGSLQSLSSLAGLDTRASFSSTSKDLSLILSPYIKIMSAGTLWSIKCNLNLFPFDIDSLFDCYIGVKAEF